MDQEYRVSFDISNIKSFVLYWNSRFFIDYWWRKKYKVPFNSSLHREICLIDMFIEYEEERLIKEFIEEERERQEDQEDYLFTGNPFKTDIKISLTSVEEIYDKIDLKGYNEKRKKENLKS